MCNVYHRVPGPCVLRILYFNPFFIHSYCTATLYFVVEYRER